MCWRIVCRGAVMGRLEDVVAVMESATETEDGGIDSAHLVRHRVAGGLGRNAAIDAAVWRRRQRLEAARKRKVTAEPIDGSSEVQVVQVHRQIDSASAAGASVPVHELQAGDRDGALRGMPLGLVVRIALGSGFTQYCLEWNAAK